MQEGLPPGYEVRDPKATEKAKATKADQRTRQVAKNLADISSMVSPEIMARARPIEYDANDLPIVPEPPREAATPQPPPQPQPRAQQPQQRATVPHPATQTKEELAAVHPVLARMLRTFGISNTKSHDIDLFSPGNEKITYSMTILPEEATAVAVQDSKARTDLSDELQVAYFQNAFVAMSVVAIDGEPIWKVFGVSPLLEESVILDRDPKNIPVRIRRECAKQLTELFWRELGPVADKLWTFYEEVVARESRISSSYEREQKELIRFVCPIDGCTNVEFQKVRIEDGEEQPWYCKVHGTILVKSIELGASDLPLV